MFSVAQSFTPKDAPLKPGSIDIRQPALLYPEARAIRRKIYLHIGPTNSGKTYHALQKFQEADKAFYAGPLRMLAREVYLRMKSVGKPCNLITGDDMIMEVDEHGNEATINSGTVEMMDTTTDFDVAVIDEIQMIGDQKRGWAWTQALLGVKAREVHLCGDPATEWLIRRIADECDDDLKVIRYERLTELKVESNPIVDGDFIRHLEPGDCLVFFSKSEILAAKHLIESSTEYKCAVVFGSLPPETRVAQAALFNDPSKPYDILLATDAIGMGLNLSVRRIIFMSMRKFDGESMQKLPIMDVKQIAGRAGRYKVADISGDKKNAGAKQDHPDSTEHNNDVYEETIEDPSAAPRAKYGLVTTLNREDQRFLKYCMVTPTPVIRQAALQLSDDLMLRYAYHMGLGSGFRRLWELLPRHAVLDPRAPYNMSDNSEPGRLASLLDEVPGLLLKDRLQLVKAPVRRYRQSEDAYSAYCRVIANGEALAIYDIPEAGVEFLQHTVAKPVPSLTETYDVIASNISLFLWLQYRFPQNFLDREAAQEMYVLCERRFNEFLDKLHLDPSASPALRRLTNRTNQSSKPKPKPKRKRRKH